MIFFVKFYLIYILFALLFWTTGWGVKKLLKIPESITYSTILFNTLIGLIAFATMVAIVYTKGKTVMIFSIFLGLTLYFLHKKDKSPLNPDNSDNKGLKGILFSVFVGLTLIYSIFFFTYIKDGFVVVIYSDYCFYADLSYRLMRTGVEHYYTIHIMPPNGVQPYHYLEVWINGFIANTTEQNHLSVLILVVYPLFVFMAVMGVCALFKTTSFNPKYLFWIAFLATFITGIYIPNISVYEYLQKKFYIESYIDTLWDYHKFSILYAIFTGIIVLFVQKKIKYGYILLLYTPVFYSTIAPALFCGVGLLIVYLFIFKKEGAKWLLLHYLISCISLFIFYAVFQDKNIVASPNKIDLDIKTKINIIGNTLIGISSLYWHIPVLIYLFLRKEIFRIFSTMIDVWLIIIIPAFGLFLWAVFSKNLDSFQLFSNVAIPIFNIASIGIIFMLFKYNKKKAFYSVFIAITGLSIYQVYHNYFSKTVLFSDKYEGQVRKLNTLKNVFENKPNRLGVFFRTQSELNQSLYYINGHFSFILFDLSCVYSDSYGVLLNVHQTNPDAYTETYRREIAKKLIKMSTFNRYIEKQKKENRFVSIPQSQIDFIREYKITYIATRPDYILPDHLKAIIKQKVDLDEQVLYLLE
jgi:hypothetical protein